MNDDSNQVDAVRQIAILRLEQIGVPALYTATQLVDDVLHRQAGPNFIEGLLGELLADMIHRHIMGQFK